MASNQTNTPPWANPNVTFSPVPHEYASPYQSTTTDRSPNPSSQQQYPSWANPQLNQNPSFGTSTNSSFVSPSSGSSPHQASNDNSSYYSSPGCIPPTSRIRSSTADSSYFSSHEQQQQQQHDVDPYMSPPHYPTAPMKIVGLYAPDLSPNSNGEAVPGRVPVGMRSPVSPSTASTTDYYDEDDTVGGRSSGADNDQMEGVDEYKKEIDVARQQGANIKALRLLDLTVTGEVHESTPSTKGTYITAGQAAADLYEKKQKEKAATKERLKVEQERYRAELLKPKILYKPKPKLAETTRIKKKPVKDENDSDETIASMKCKMYLEDEEMAKKKALKLLPYSNLD